MREKAKADEFGAREREAKAARAEADAQQAELDAERLRQEARGRQEEAEKVRTNAQEQLRKADEVDPDVVTSKRKDAAGDTQNRGNVQPGQVTDDRMSSRPGSRRQCPR